MATQMAATPGFVSAQRMILGEAQLAPISSHMNCN